MKVEIREFCGDWALDIHLGKETVVLYFNSRCNAELVKSVFEWEDAHPNEAIPYMPDLSQCKAAREDAKKLRGKGLSKGRREAMEDGKGD